MRNAFNVKMKREEKIDLASNKNVYFVLMPIGIYIYIYIYKKKKSVFQNFGAKVFSLLLFMCLSLYCGFMEDPM